MNDTLKVYEVGPRDGLQNETTHLDTAAKLDLVRGLLEAGLRHVEVTSFVKPEAVPQLADADVVMAAAVELVAGAGTPVELVGLVFSDRGYDRALASGCRSMAFGVAVSDTFSRRNTRNTSAEAMATAALLVRRAHSDGVRTRAYVMTAWVCPFEGPIPAHRAAAVAHALWDLGVNELAIADTVGYASPLEVGRLIDHLARTIPISALAVHLHDTQALGLANAVTALQAGVRTFDSSIGGLGGCPFAPGAAGNLATEDLVFLAYKMGLGTGVDFPALWGVIAGLEQRLGRPIGGRIRAWWESSDRHEPMLGFS
jgi:hydroxymethylglutaryl-CoA lyase